MDATLVANSSGGFSPKAAANPLSISAGGTGPLATMTAPDGKALSLTLPFTLPAPTVSGDAATYANVLPDTDLVVTATVRGDISEVLVVKTAAAAANPALSTLNISMSGPGLTISADSQNNLQADVANTTTTDFFAPAPTMWDSSTGSSTGTAGAKAMATMSAPSSTGSSDASTATGPGGGAHSAVMPTTVSGSTVTLKPVSSVLSGSNIHYPVFIDPSWMNWQASVPFWTWTQSAYPDQNNFGHTGSSDTDFPGVGTCGYYANGGSCSPNDTERTYYQFDTSKITGYTVNTATLKLQEYSSADWSCTNTYAVSLYLANGISTSTTWNHPPGEGSMGLTDHVGGSGSSNCHDNVPFSFDVTSKVQDAATSPWQHIAFGLRGDESNVNAFKRLVHEPTLTMTYDITPNTPTSLSTSNPIPQETSAGTKQPCDATTNSTTEAWVGNPGSAGLTMSANVSSPTSPAQPVRGWFDLWDDSATGFPTVDSGYSDGGGYKSSGSTVSYTTATSKLTDGHAYAWDASTSDGLLSSGASAQTCHFRVDLQSPTVSFGTSTDFPAAGSGIAPIKYAGQSGQLPFTDTDPAASNGLASGVGCLRWGTDPTQLTSAPWQCGSSMPSGSITVTPTHWGTNLEYIQAEDNAGNASQIAGYAFYVPWNANGPKPVFGDTTGDGSADMVVPSPDGNLYNHGVPGNTTATSPVISFASNQANSPSGDAWTGYRIAHRGSLRGGMNVDDLLVHKDGNSYLYTYKNPGNTGTDGRFDSKSPVAKPPCYDPNNDGHCAGYATNWSTTASFIATGDITTNALNAGKFQDRTGILTEETNASGDDALWFYPSISDNTLNNPVLVSATGWKGWDLIASGDWHGDGRPGFWARNRTTGVINAYTFTLGAVPATDSFGNPIANTTVTAVTAVSPGTQIGSGVTAASYPLVGSDGDLTGDGIPDLWATTPSGALQVWPGVATANLVTGFGTANAAGTTADFDQWPLAQTTTEPTGLLDSDTTNPLTASGTGVSWAANQRLTANAAVSLDGSSGQLTASTAAVNTAGSYTITAWVNLNNLATTQTVLSQATNNHQAFYIGYDQPNNQWYYMTTTSDTASTNYPYAGGGAAPVHGTWAHLAAVYNAGSNTMTLYVNGAYAGSAYNATPAYAASKPLVIGGLVNTGGVLQNPVNGLVSDVRTFAQALTPDQVNQIWNTTKPSS
ncbi:hypothetical protein DN069_38465 [Streptacidiphilus pinicola]|uniref:LamG-like jellyroll fold domain-containing protein n=1 Tax=Streptacidiphilus pinicola TaxID=2219663 RepID=A0A2X0IS56_9ACTN|nr:hypothetical protein DN069_38465 [Streptacidiphilus pinicola]